MENEFGQPIVGFCGYCHREIFVGDCYQSNEEGLYHSECYEIKDRYYDSMEDLDDK